MAIDHIVFYGTLKRSTSNNLQAVLKNDLIYQGKCLLPGKLYDMGRYPALKEGDGSVHGELYQIVDDKVLALLDDYEAKDNQDALLPGFTRKLIQLLQPEMKTWAYYYNGNPPDELNIASGKWEN